MPEESCLNIIFTGMLGFLFAALTRIFVLHIRVPFPQSFTVYLLGLLLGCLSDKWMPELRCILDLGVENPVLVASIVLPVIMFEAAYNTTMETIYIAGFRITAFIIVSLGVSCMSVAVLVSHYFNYGWSLIEGIVLGSIIAVPGPVFTISFLKRMCASSKLQAVLEGEAVIGNCVAFFIFKCSILYMTQTTMDYLFTIDELLLAFPCGYFMAKLASCWLAMIIKDTVNEVSVTIIFTYFCYFLAQVIRASEIVSVVIFGVCMTQTRSVMGLNAEKTLLRVVHVLSCCFNWNLVMIYGMATYYYILPTLEFEDVYNAIIIFVMLNIARLFVVIISAHLPVINHVQLSVQSLLIIWLCNIRGSMSFVLGLCILNESFGISNRQMMFFHLTAQLVAALIFNSTMSNIVIRYDVWSDVDRKKSKVMRNALDYLNDLTVYAIRVFKHHNRDMADADWNYVYNVTSMEHPLIRSNKVNKSNKMNKLTKLWNKWSGFPSVHEMGTRDNVTEDSELTAVSRILTMMKCSYRKQYEEGLVSRDAIKRLMHWSHQAIARGNQLIPPSKTAAVLKVSRFLNYLRHQLWYTLNKLLYYEKTGNIWYRAYRYIMLLVHVLDLSATTHQLVLELFHRRSQHYLILESYNAGLLLFYAVFFILRLLPRINKRMLWDYCLLLVLAMGLLDEMVLSVISIEDKQFSFLRPIVISTRFFRLFRLMELSIMLCLQVIVALENKVCRQLSQGYDIGRSYVRGRLEVLRKINYVGQNFPEAVREKFMLTCKQHKLETTKMLGYLQVEHPLVSVSVKTRQAVRSVLKSHLKLLKDMEHSRALKYRDGNNLEKLIETRLVETMRSRLIVTSRTDGDIVSTVSWIKYCDQLFKLIMKKGKVKMYKEGDVVLRCFAQPGGIYVILSGIVKLERTVETDGGDLEPQVVDYMVCGNVIGEYTFLTGKPRHKAVKCETNVSMMFISNKLLINYMGQKPNDLTKGLCDLEQKMWQVVATRTALRFLLGESELMGFSQTGVIMKLVDAQLVDGSEGQEVLTKHAAQSDLILVNGKLFDVIARKIILSPSYIQLEGRHLAPVEQDKARPILLAIPPLEEQINQISMLGHMFSHHVHEIPQQTDSSVTLSSCSDDYQLNFVPKHGYAQCGICSKIPSASLSSDSSTEAVQSPVRRELKGLRAKLFAILKRDPRRMKNTNDDV